MNRKSGKVTVYDISREAGVSVATVSKVLSKADYKISEETRSLVFSTAEKLGYGKKNDMWKPKETFANHVAVITPNIMNPYYASLVTGLESALQSGDMTVMLYNTRNSKELEIKYAEQILESNYAGVIVVSICDQFQHISRLIERGVKVVAFEQDIDLACNKVGFNYRKGGFMATEYLISRGNHRIGFVSAPLTRASRKQVFEGYKKALGRYGISYCPEYVRIAENETQSTLQLYEYRNGMNQVQQMMKEQAVPEAIFCINDLTAIGVIHGLQENGYRVPEDVGVIGFDNIYMSAMVTPQLTTIEQSTYELGTVAAEILVGSIHDPNRKPVSIVLEPKLIERKSV